MFNVQSFLVSLGLHKTEQGLLYLKEFVSKINNSETKMETANYMVRRTEKTRLQTNPTESTGDKESVG